MKNGKTSDVSSDDWTYCQQSLLDVSRTFARPIEILPETLKKAVTCGYLLCRITDTIEDYPELRASDRDDLYFRFLRVLEEDLDADEFSRRFHELTESNKERSLGSDALLARNMARVMRVFRSLPSTKQEPCARWISEMARGMYLYSHRPVGNDRIAALVNLTDLERYCYFVAGTVGHMLTELFLEDMGNVPQSRVTAMQNHGEAFGIGLQLVNVLKDVTDDRARGWSFIPRSVCAQQGITLVDLLNPAHRKAAHAAVEPVFDKAAARLHQALEYCLAIPPEHMQIRVFCIVPLWLAVRTLVLARGNDAIFTPNQPVKISRGEVETLIQDSLSLCKQDDALRQRYEALWREPVPPAPSRKSQESLRETF